MNSRTLKIEEDGDAFKKKIRPKIRLKGCWLEKAGFPPGSHVTVKCIAPGIIELRSNGPVPMLRDRLAEKWAA